MDKILLEKRLRQLMAIDKNAMDIYTDLAKLAPDNKTKEILLAIAIDETRHFKTVNEMLELLSK